MTYRPAKLGQICSNCWSNGSKDCICALAAALIDYATIGAVRPTGADIRRKSGDYSGGISFLQATDVAMDYGVRLEARYGLTRSQVDDIAAAGSMFGIIIHTQVTRFTNRRTNAYIGPHGELVARGPYLWRAGDTCGCDKTTTAGHYEYTVDDPGTTQAGYQPWSATLLYEAAEYITGRMSVLVSPDTTGVKRKAIKGGHVYAQPRLDAKVTAEIDPGRVYYIQETANGGQWPRGDGTMADGWAHIAAGWMRGDRFARVNA